MTYNRSYTSLFGLGINSNLVYPILLIYSLFLGPPVRSNQALFRNHKSQTFPGQDTKPKHIFILPAFKNQNFNSLVFPKNIALNQITYDQFSRYMIVSCT